MAIPVILIATGSLASLVGAKTVEWYKNLEPHLGTKKSNTCLPEYHTLYYHL